MSRRPVDLSHPIVAGKTTYPGLPAPEIETYISRADSTERLAPGVSFHIGRLCMVANTGTYMDAPFHFHESGADTAELPLDRLVDLPVVVIDARTDIRVEVGRLNGLPDIAGCAVLVRTDWSRHWGTSQYAEGSPHLSRDVAQALIAARVALVGIDALNIDDVNDLSRPAHRGLLAAGVPIIEHVTNLAALPARTMSRSLSAASSAIRTVLAGRPAAPASGLLGARTRSEGYGHEVLAEQPGVTRAGA